MPSPAARVVALILLAIFLVPGPCLLGVAVISAVRNAIFLSTCAHTEGSVVALREARGKGSRRSYAPIFQFTGDDGQTYTVTSNIAEKESKFRFGQRVTVLYEHGRPQHARIDSFAQLWMFQLVAGVVGGGFSTLPVLVLVRRRKLARANAESPLRV